MRRSEHCCLIRFGKNIFKILLGNNQYPAKHERYLTQDLAGSPTIICVFKMQIGDGLNYLVKYLWNTSDTPPRRGINPGAIHCASSLWSCVTWEDWQSVVGKDYWSSMIHEPSMIHDLWCFNPLVLCNIRGLWQSVAAKRIDHPWSSFNLKRPSLQQKKSPLCVDTSHC